MVNKPLNINNEDQNITKKNKHQNCLITISNVLNELSIETLNNKKTQQLNNIFKYFFITIATNLLVNKNIQVHQHYIYRKKKKQGQAPTNGKHFTTKNLNF